MMKPKRLSSITALILFGAIIGTAIPVQSIIVSTENLIPSVLNYNFNTENENTTNMNVEYWDDIDVSAITEDWESGGFTNGSWTTWGSPIVTASYNPAQGVYHAGASIGLSGAGNHTFETTISCAGLTNISIGYQRFVQDLGGGDVYFTADWWNGTDWVILETISVNSPYTRELWSLNSTADNIPDLKVRFNVTLTAGNVNNGAWVDDIIVASYMGFNTRLNITNYPSVTNPWNDTYEQLMYDVYLDADYYAMTEWVLLRVDPDMIYQASNPNDKTVTDMGGGIWNITGYSYIVTFYHFWFLRPLYTGICFTQSANLYPTEVIESSSAYLFRFEFWSGGQTNVELTMPSNSYTYRSINPYATVSTTDSITYTVDNMLETSLYWIWFSIDKTDLIIIAGGNSYTPDTDTDITTPSDDKESFVMPFGWVSLVGVLLLLIGILKVPVPYVKSSTLKIGGIMLIILDILIRGGS